MTALGSTIKFIDEMAMLLTQFRNSYFEIARALESLIIAESLILVEQWDNDVFLRTLCNDLRKGVEVVDCNVS